MNIPTLILTILTVAAITAATVNIFIKHKKHKGSCNDCDAQGCCLHSLLSGRDRRRK